MKTEENHLSVESEEPVQRIAVDMQEFAVCGQDGL